jgi:hypothetical protein
MRKAKLPRRTVPACVVVIDTRPGRAPAPVRSRWTCETCGEGGDWTTPAEANAQGEAHVERVRERARVAP